MDLKSGYPFWAVRNGLMLAFPPLEHDLACDVAVIGAGITGALVADELVRHGHDVAVLEQRDVGWGSTCASTALLQYEIDVPMTGLAERHGEAAAAQAYLACLHALDELAERVRPFRDVDFARCHSLYFASRGRDVPGLADELALRRRHGIAVAGCDRGELHERFGVAAPAGLLSRDAARVDPYRLTYRLLARCRRAGAHVHDRTEVVEVRPGRGCMHLRTAEGVNLRAGHVVVAAGYAAQHWLPRPVARNRSSYAYVTDPLPAARLGALSRTMMWETARPYLYLRSTGDGRLVVGGEDDAVDIPARRDRRVARKAARLERKLARRLPGLEAEPAFAWAGTFAETEDGLPFFGAHPALPRRILFAMAYGGNGITYSTIGAGMLRAAIERRRHPLERLFGFARLG